MQPPASEELALAALEWIEATAVPDGDGVWCDAQVFRLLAQLADDRGGAGGTRDGSGASGAGHTSGDASGAGGSGWRALADRCWHTVTTSGLPQRLRPGFWDNSGRCCGTAGRDPSYAVQWPDHPSASRMAPGRPPERAMVPSEG